MLIQILIDMHNKQSIFEDENCLKVLYTITIDYVDYAAGIESKENIAGNYVTVQKFVIIVPGYWLIYTVDLLIRSPSHIEEL